jgi:hypothetical protein
MVWPLALLLFLILCGWNVFYVTNRRLFSLLEREDWPALAEHLEQRIFRRGRYFSPLVRLLANSYLVLSDFAAVQALENKTAIAKPALVAENALVFGAARILSKNYGAAARFFAEQIGQDKGKNAGVKHWLEWYHGFALFLDGQYAPAAEEFKALALSSADALITALAAFFLAEFTA